jgi:hypothetical protein
MSATWWLKYRAGGRIVRQSSGSDKEKQARKLLAVREGAAAEGKVILPRADKVTVRELADDLKAEYAAKRRRSADRLEFSLAHLLPVLGDRRAVQLTSAEITKYAHQRQEAGAANATVNRELAALRDVLHRRAGRQDHAEAAHRLAAGGQRAPGLLRARAVRGGARPARCEPAAGGHVRLRHRLAHPRGSANPPVASGGLPGGHGAPGAGHHEESRGPDVLPDARTAGVPGGQKAATAALQRQTGRIIPWVFHRNGEPVRCFRGSWAGACRRAGTPGRILHDFRRTAVRNLERAGVPRSTAMAMVGHKTEAIYRRYAIVDTVMLQEGAQKLAAFTEAQAR